MGYSPDEKGTIAEMAIVLAATKLRIGVLKPVNEGLRYDLVFDVGERLHRVQCKWANRQGNVIVVNARTFRRTRTGYVRTCYTSDEIDLLVAYCAATDRCYAFTPGDFHGRWALHLRLEPPRNNQRAGIRWAHDYELERLDWAPRGAVAQLGERQRGTLEATGSSPVGSTPLTLVDPPPRRRARAP